MHYIGVFCSASDVGEKYIRVAKEFAQLIAANGHHLVWGGSDVGMMKIVAAGVREGGGKIVGVSIDVFAHVAHTTADEMIVAKSLHDRKATMLKRSDVIVMLVGGIGTLDEVMDVIELKKQGAHTKPIIIINTENFYAGLKTQLETMEKEGFLPEPLATLLSFIATPKEAIQYINSISRG